MAMSCDGCSSLVIGSRPCGEIPFYLSSSPELGGRYLAANRKLNSGEVIMTELPLATAPGLLSEHICLSCHQTFITPHVCSQCNNRLCSEECETSPGHLKECSQLRRLSRLFLSEQKNANRNVLNLMLPFRLLRLRFENPEKWKLLMELESHIEERKNTPLWNLIEFTIAPHLKTMFANEWEDLDTLTIQKVCGIIDINSFEVPIDFSYWRKLKFPEQTQNCNLLLYQ